jgi:hypothetical protein
VKPIILLPLMTLLFSTCSTKGMLKDTCFAGSLSEIEKLIVWKKIKKIGKETVLDMIHTPKNNSDTHHEFTDLPTVTKIRKNKTDSFSLSIINAIEQQEKEYGYIPQQISEKKRGKWHITLPTNYLGNYTRYWHKTDSRGEYIELYSSFSCKPALLEAIYEY